MRGKYILGIHPSVALYTLKKLLPTVLKKHSQLEFTLLHNLSRKKRNKACSFKLAVKYTKADMNIVSAFFYARFLVTSQLVGPWWPGLKEACQINYLC